jgi:hypothetical protein
MGSLSQRGRRRICLAAICVLLAACSVRRENESAAAGRPAPVRGSSALRGDASQPASGYLSVLLKLQGESITVEKLERVQSPLRKRRGARQRRGLLMVAKDAQGQQVHQEVVPDPRYEVAEVADQDGAIHPVASSTTPKYLLVRLPLTARQLLIHDARQGALDGEYLEGDSNRSHQSADTPVTHPLLTTLNLGEH